MNERIRELAEQAGIDFFNSTDPEYSGRVYCEAWTEQQQKFAELIVRECLEQVWYTREDYINENISEVIKQRMKEHFGVRSA